MAGWYDGREQIDFDVSFIPEYIETHGKDHVYVIYARVMKYKPFFALIPTLFICYE